MKLKLHLFVCLAAALFAPAVIAQNSDTASNVEQAKELSSMSGRPLLAVAGEAKN